MQKADRVGFDGAWFVYLTCRHSAPAKNEQEATRMAALGVPVRCHKCGENGTGATP